MMTLIQERQEVDAELCKLKESLRDAEASAKKQEEERNQALQRLQTSTEVSRKICKGNSNVYCSGLFHCRCLFPSIFTCSPTQEQRALLNQIQVMNKSFTHMKQNHSEVQEQLSEANNKISQACLVCQHFILI